VLEVPPKYQYGPEALEQLYASSSSGQQVPLRTLITSAIKVAPLVVNHQAETGPSGVHPATAWGLLSTARYPAGESSIDATRIAQFARGDCD
jgi:hypothetical protein